MHIRSSAARGMPVVDDGTQQAEGFVDRPLIDPDSGKIIGFFIAPASFGASELFLQSSEIAGWGTSIHIRSADCLAPLEDLVRLQRQLDDRRTFLGQPIRTKADVSMGVLTDIQFNTKTLAIEWLFPRKFFFLRQPIPVTEILEVTEEAIIIKDPLRAQKQRVEVPEKDAATVIPSDPAVA